MIDRVVIQVEPVGEFQPKPLSIVTKKVTLLQNQAISQVKVQWNNFGLDEATWEMDYAIREAYAFLFQS